MTTYIKNTQQKWQSSAESKTYSLPTVYPVPRYNGRASGFEKLNFPYQHPPRYSGQPILCTSFGPDTVYPRYNG